MPLDLSKLTDAVAKVADLAKSHADTAGLVATFKAQYEAAKADLTQAQVDVDALTAQLLAAATTPAESAGIAAVWEALFVAPAPVDVPVAPVDVPVAPAVDPVAPPVAPVAAPAQVGTTFLPGDPRANA